MPETQTLNDAVIAFHVGYPHFVPNQQNERLWLHDMLHTILNIKPKNAIREETIALYQAVLLEDVQINPRIRKHRQWGNNVQREDVKDTILPRIRGYLAKKAERHQVAVTSGLSETAAEIHYDKANILKELIETRFNNRKLGEIPIAELKETDAGIFTDLVSQMHATYRDRFPRRTIEESATGMRF